MHLEMWILLNFSSNQILFFFHGKEILVDRDATLKNVHPHATFAYKEKMIRLRYRMNYLYFVPP